MITPRSHPHSLLPTHMTTSIATATHAAWRLLSTTATTAMVKMMLQLWTRGCWQIWQTYQIIIYITYSGGRGVPRNMESTSIHNMIIYKLYIYIYIFVVLTRSRFIQEGFPKAPLTLPRTLKRHSDANTVRTGILPPPNNCGKFWLIGHT